MAALAGRPAAPRQLHRSAVPGLVLLAAAFVLFTISAGGSGSAKGNTPELALGFVALIAAVILLSPLCLAALSRFSRPAPIAVRLALRDLSRYRARSGSALAAISLGVLIAVIISVAAAARYGNVLDYAGPNLAANQLIVAPGQPAGSGNPGGGPSDQGLAGRSHRRGSHHAAGAVGHFQDAARVWRLPR